MSWYHAEQRRRIDVDEIEGERHDSCRQRAGELAAQLGAARRLQFGDDLAGQVRDGVGERASHLRQPERVAERIAVARVFRAVERQHARAEHLRRREARIVDRERRRVTHHLDGQCARDVTTHASSSGIHATGPPSAQLGECPVKVGLEHSTGSLSGLDRSWRGRLSRREVACTTS